MEFIDTDLQPEETVVHGKQPWLGALLTVILPGLGHLYAKKYYWGLLAFVGYNILLLLFLYLLFFSGVSFNALIYTSLIIAFCWIILFAYHSHNIISQTNSYEFEYQRKQSKDPWKAVLLSYLIPGLGHAYIKKGGYFLLFALSYQFIDKFGANFIHPLASYWISLFFGGFVMLHVFHISQPNEFRYSLKKMLRIWGLMFLVNTMNFGLTLYIVFNIGQLYNINGTGMEPTISSSSQVFVNKHHTVSPMPGDIIAFRKIETDVVYIQRVIGVGGQTINIDDSGLLMVDGKEFIIDQVNYQIDKPDLSVFMKGPFLKNGPYKVPEGKYFVVGDNFENSFDSRQFGPIDKCAIIGKAVRIITEEEYEKIIDFFF
ncbi:MAG: signal peptidase I [Deltaproteobacteria bacterium]|nr:signal peptidase I [Deltaproteobacteria bacterium]